MTMVQNPKCKVCSLPVEERKVLDRALLRGENITALSKKYKLSRDVLYRHKKLHIGGAAARGVRQMSENHGVRLLEDLDELVITARRILRQAEQDGHPTTALKAIKEVRGSIVALAQVTHSVWQQQNSEQQTIILEQQENQTAQWVQDGLRALTPDERTEFRRLTVKMLSAAGSQYSLPEAEDPKTGDYTSQGRNVEIWPLVQRDTGYSDQDLDPDHDQDLDPEDMDLDPEDMDLDPGPVKMKRTRSSPSRMKRTR